MSRSLIRRAPSLAAPLAASAPCVARSALAGQPREGLFFVAPPRNAGKASPSPLGRSYHFASTRFEQALHGIPKYDPASLRKETIKYLESFDPELWHKEPMHTIVDGVSYRDGQTIDTTDARSRVNGKQIIADEAAYNAVVSLMKKVSPSLNPKVGEHREEFREKVRRMETALLSDEYACKLVGNQAVDFGKQDGVTEIEESVQANTVERRLNDQLEMDEALGKVTVHREPALVACVSNFSNFLDLFRKTVRNIEMGVPVIVLSRSNTSQHCFRWFLILQHLMEVHQIPRRLATFASFSIEQQRRLMKEFPASPVYFTGSREVARMIKEVSPLAMTSTGGPNTMFTTYINTNVAAAVQMSACIENSGQCTALRHLVCPTVDKAFFENDVFGETVSIVEPVESLRASGFASLFKGGVVGGGGGEPGYEQHPTLPVYWKVTKDLPESIDENWRQVYLDVTSRPASELESDAFTGQLAQWLNREQPISLSVNGPVALALRMWELTGMAVFSWGTEEQPALSCQARPQEGECFGEFPPRIELQKHTRFPVLVPTATPGYNTSYCLDFLKTHSLFPCPNTLEFARPLLEQINDPAVKGYCLEMLSYIRDAASGPKPGTGARTCLYGLQRPPLDGSKTYLVCGQDTTLEELAPPLMPFFATNARSQAEIVVHPKNEGLLKALWGIQLGAISVVQGDGTPAKDAYNVVNVAKMDDYPLVGHYMSLFFPIGHCKSVRGGDKEFLDAFSKSKKWLRVHTSG